MASYWTPFVMPVEDSGEAEASWSEGANSASRASFAFWPGDGEREVRETVLVRVREREE